MNVLAIQSSGNKTCICAIIKDDVLQHSIKHKRKEIWINDKEQMFFTAVATGHDDDVHMDDYYRYGFQSGNRWNYILQDERLDYKSIIPEGLRAQHMFGLWIYVYDVIHVEKKVETWDETETADGRKVFVEHVNI